MKQRMMALVLAAFLVLSAVVVGGATAETIKNTWMVYSNGDNNLEGSENVKLDQMSLGGGSTNDLTIIAMCDRLGTANDGIYLITAATATGNFPAGDTKLWSPAPVNGVQPEIDMGDPATLAFFINYAKTNYPADRYILSMPDHGGGYRDVPFVRGISYDDDPASHMSIQDLGSTLDASGVHFDLAYLDACLMSMAEVGDELQNSVNVMVASEEITYGGGTTPYKDLVSWLRANPTATATDYGKRIIDGYMGNAGDGSEYAETDLAQMPNIFNSMNSLGTLLSANMPAWQPQILAAASATQRYYWKDFADIVDFTNQLDARITDAQLQTATAAVRTAVTGAVLYELHKGTTMQNSHGLSTWIFGGSGLPKSVLADQLQEYTPLSFAGTQWDEFNIDLMKTPTTITALVATPASPYVGKDFSLSGTIDPDISLGWTVLNYVYLQKWDGTSWTDTGESAWVTSGGAFTLNRHEGASGTYTFRAQYRGSDDPAHLFFSSDSPSLDVTVQKVPTTLSALTADPASPYALHDFTLGGTMTSDIGAVVGETVSLQKLVGATWTDTGVTATTGTGGAFTFTTHEAAAGTYSYRAHYPEGSVYLASDGASSPVTVQKIPTQLSTPVPSSATPPINTPFTLTGTLTAESAGLAGKTVKLWTSTDSGATWTDTALTAPTTGTAGTYTFTVTETVAGWRQYKVTFGNDPAYADSESGGATVRINRAPDVSLATASVAMLWSPMHGMTAESVLGVTDPDGDPVMVTITQIVSDEQTATMKGSGGKQYSPDAVILGGNMAQVRAERSGESNGRVYILSFTASDGFGGVTPGAVRVLVPLDKTTPCVCNSPMYDACMVN